MGTGENIYFWTDNWLAEPLVDLLQIDPLFHADFIGSVADVIVDGGWDISVEVLATPGVAARLGSIVLPRTHLPDSLVWPHSADGKLTAKLAFTFLKPVDTIIPWASMIWKTCIPSSHSFIFWRLIHGKVPTDENLCTRGCIIVSVCSFCSKTDETSEHFFAALLQRIFGTGLGEN